VLQAINALPSAWTGSINEEVRLPYLRSLEREGLVRVIDGPHGSLGYKWTLTPKGRQALKAADYPPRGGGLKFPAGGKHPLPSRGDRAGVFSVCRHVFQ
jgi:hypothetical protein